MRNVRPEVAEGWATWKFDEIAQSIIDRVDNPVEAGVTRYVGLEHLDPGEVTLRRWGSPGDVSATKLRFQAGDIIYGRRRAYQRKLAVAPFEGIASAHALILRARPEVCLPEFLPYFLQSDAFHERALAISVGSLSPTINWKTLKVQEFALPPLEEQKRIVKAMAVAANARRRYEDVLRVNEDLTEALLHDFAWCRADSLEPLIDAFPGELSDGDWIESKDQSPSGIRLLQLADIGPGRFLDKSNRFVSRDTAERLRCSALRPGDLLISRMADPIGRACAVPEEIGDAITAVDVCIARSEFSSEERAYWIGLFNSSRWRSLCEAQAGGSTRTRISRRKLEQIPVPSLTTAAREQLGGALIAAQQLDSAQRRSLEALVDVSRTLAGFSPDDRSEGCDVQ